MKILVCSTPRSRSSILIDYLIKEHKLHNFSEKLILAHGLSTKIDDRLLKNQSREQYYEKIFKSQISLLLSHTDIVAKLWGTMLSYDSSNDYKFYTKISNLVPFEQFDKIYYLERNIYDVAASWFYKENIDKIFIGSNQNCKSIIAKAVIDVLTLDKLKDFFDTKSYSYINLPYDEIPNIIKDHSFERKPNNIDYKSAIVNYSKLIECVDAFVYQFSYIKKLNFS